MHPNVDTFLDKLSQWQDEMRLLRQIALDCGLQEAWKWRMPCYTFNGKNILNIGNFKAYSALSFFNGSLLQDPKKLLHSPGDHSQFTRQFRFTSVAEINDMEADIKAYIYEAIEVEKAGLKVQTKSVSDYEVPEELIQLFHEHPDLKTAFDALTPGRQRGYLLHFAQPKQSATRTTRIEKNMDRIFQGKGLQDCICGKSKRFPRCDGSHKFA